MASYRFILQGIDANSDHLASIQHLFELPDIERGLIASAFINAAGATLVAETAAPFTDRIKFYLGIRNGVTTVQAIQVLKDHNIYPYLVDTATLAFIFHPKVYMLCNPDHARLITGSANITTGGFIKNIEASVEMVLDLSQPADAELVDEICTAFQLLEQRHPDNVFQLTAAMDLHAMTEQGLLADERSAGWRTTARAAEVGRTQERARMRLHTRPFPTTRRTATATPATIPVPGTTANIPAVANTQLLWKSGGLKRRDLNIPTSANTNPTGSMLLKKGDPSQNIDPRSYFRHTIFSDENWTWDTRPGRTHLERAHVRFRIVIRGIDYGVQELLLSHNTRTTTAAYLQNNSMTQIHWGDTVRPMIAHEDLLGCVLSLYAPQESDSAYTLVFDDE